MTHSEDAAISDAWFAVSPGRLERLRSALSVVGLWAMSFGGMLISGGYALAGLAVLLVGMGRVGPATLALVPAGGAMLALSLWHIVSTILALVRPNLPAPIQVALSQPRWPRGVNLLIVLWWLMHVSTGAMFAIAALVERPPDPVGVVVLAVMSMVFTYTAHGFLLLVVTCLSRNPDWIVRVWGWRRIVSIGHGLAVLAVGLVR